MASLTNSPAPEARGNYSMAAALPYLDSDPYGVRRALDIFPSAEPITPDDSLDKTLIATPRTRTTVVRSK